MTVAEIQKEAARIVRKYLGKKTPVYLFGSQAKGTALPVSDVDIAVEIPAKKKHELFRIREEVDRLRTLRKIDIIDLSLVSKKFRRHIFKHAIPL